MASSIFTRRLLLNILFGQTKTNQAAGERKSTLREAKLPAGGYATPTIYQIDNKQYVVIAAGGGGKCGTPLGDTYVAFTLPDR